MILDTNAVSAILAGDKLIHVRLPPEERQHLPVVVIGEYQFGMLGSKRRKKLELAFERLESQSIVLRCDRDTADMYAAIRHGPRGDFAWVVRPDSTVEIRPVAVRQRLGGTALINRGLEANEKVVLDGHSRLQAGARVEIVPETEDDGPKVSSAE